MKLNSYAWRVLFPLVGLFLAGCTMAALGLVKINWLLVFSVWFLIGPVGIGVGFHRLFSHRQFATYRPIEIALALLGTLAAYAPILFWVSQHQYHHQRSDQADDPSSPSQAGFMESFLWYRLRPGVEDKIDLRTYCSKKVLLDPVLRSISRHFVKIVWCTVAIILAIDYKLLLSAYLLPVMIEHTRINLVSSASHMNWPTSYRNFETDDTSYNNVILGFLTMGFAWHNNHHNDERLLLLSKNWWELDIEGLVARLISKPQKTH